MSFCKDVKRKNQAGFTFVEIMTVVAIISVLSTIVLFNINEARKEARDVIRITDLKKLQQTFDLFYSENGHLPTDLFSSVSATGATFPSNSSDATWNAYATSFFPNGLRDPKNGNEWISGWSDYGKLGYFYIGKTNFGGASCENAAGATVTDYELPVIITSLERYNDSAPYCNAPDFNPGHSTNCYNQGCNFGKTWLCMGVGPNKITRENTCLPQPPLPPVSGK
jgi:prepilin-type N-terminal cleavage/methylation domain-containing protein